MAKVLPFHGILYNREKIADPAAVVAPPYDVISRQQQEAFHNQHPNNIIRLILGENKPGDNSNENRHTRAAVFFNKWLKEKILITDPEPVFYINATTFEHNRQMITRYGLIARVRLEPFEKGIILPHEKTFSKVKSERLELMKVCHANFSPIFALYSDQNAVLSILQNEIQKLDSLISIKDQQNQIQKLWRISDQSICNSISKAMEKNKLFIADGHHRYETALNYRNWVAENEPDFDSSHPANYIMMYLCSMNDPGLIILPAHRLLKNVSKKALDTALKKLEEWFMIKVFSFEKESRGPVQKKFITAIKASADQNTIGIYQKDRSEFYLLTLKPGIMRKVFGQEIPEALTCLDVTVLTRLIFMKAMGFDQAGLDDEKLIAYSSFAENAVEMIDNNGFDAGFILNHTKIEQVQNVAGNGLIMPRKSTYFYPKVISGMVQNSLEPGAI